jgi:hypothetical protein
VVTAHLGEIAVPEARMPEVEDLARLGPTDELFERALDSSRVSPLTAQADRLFEQILTKHKICPFHVQSVPRVGWKVHPPEVGSTRLGQGSIRS